MIEIITESEQDQIFSFSTPYEKFSLLVCETPNYPPFLHGSVYFKDPEEQPLEGLSLQKWLAIFLPQIQRVHGSCEYNEQTVFYDIKATIGENSVLIMGSFGNLELNKDGTFRYCRAI